jgi:dolichol-phosphate mannosyltransferase
MSLRGGQIGLSCPQASPRKSMNRILVAIPVYNEQQYVAGVVADVLRITGDLLVVDDGSTDSTPEFLAGMPGITVIRHPENLGYGRSLIDAFQFAQRQGFDWLITLDCDEQHEPDRIPAFIERAAKGDVDIVSGSRYLTSLPGNTPAPPDRRRINERITRILNANLGLALTDAFCGFKAYRTAAVAELSLSEPGYAFPVQFWVEAVANGLHICELPVSLIYNDLTRHFGGALDDPDDRLRHYIDVFRESCRRSSVRCRLAAG